MSTQKRHTIYTIGHSTHTFEVFLEMLQSFKIEVLTDIRSLPGSNKYPQFNKENLEKYLAENGIEYLHLLNLGGRRKVNKDSHNNRWHNNSFKAYADYMETEAFKTAIENLQQIAVRNRVAYMCAESVWWRCHRSMVSDYLKAKEWQVLHIMAIGKMQEHRYTSPAKVINGCVSYSDDDLFSC